MSADCTLRLSDVRALISFCLQEGNSLPNKPRLTVQFDDLLFICRQLSSSSLWDSGHDSIQRPERNGDTGMSVPICRIPVWPAVVWLPEECVYAYVRESLIIIDCQYCPASEPDGT